MRAVLSLCVLARVALGLGAGLEPFVFGAFTSTGTFAVAQRLGFFEAQGLNVTLSPIPNSTFRYARLLDGTFDMLTGTIDNAVNLRFNTNASLAVAGQLDQGPDLVVAGVPGINSVLDLRGKPIMVDSPVSGFVFLLRKILSLHGLPPSDYTFQVVGSTSTRFQFLSNGTLPDGTPVFGTILTYPFSTDTELAAHLDPPLPILARVSDFVNPFSSSALTVASSAFDNLTPASPHARAIAAMLSANRFLASGGPCSRAAIAAELGLPADSDVVSAELAALTDPATGETAQTDFEVNPLALFNVIDVRTLQNGFAGAGERFDFVDAITPGAGKLIDYRLRDIAKTMLTDGPDACEL
ncbi:hypothetical protein AURDEDRAFT_89067 [Auricularia subglabra TFB-10046 SS5]|nr:hypothetical protein AURDEDRAFT_89067 [Auricularia subglabra TFB-10046 SS5]